MYAALWRALPGPRWVKLAELLVLAALALVVLFTWVFPFVSTLLPAEDVTVPDPANFIPPSQTLTVPSPGGPS